MGDLTSQLSVGNVDDAELSTLLLSFYGRASQRDTTIVYGRKDGEQALAIEYKEDRIVSATVGPDFQEQELVDIRAKIQSELLSVGDRRVGREVLFAARRVTGYFEYADDFRISPVPPDSPQPELVWGDFPFVLEFWFTDSAHSGISLMRRRHRATELTLVLNALLADRIHFLGSEYRRHWVLVDGGSRASRRFADCVEGYSFDELRHVGDDFVPLADEVAQIPRLYLDEYQKGLRPSVEPLAFPINIDDLLSRFFALGDDSRRCFLRSAYWFDHACRVQSFSHSACFMALLQAIEAIAPKEHNSEKCSKCGKPTGKATAPIRELIVWTVTPEKVARQFASKMLHLRGKLTHGGGLLLSDQEAWPTGMNPELWEQSQDTDTVFKLTRTVMANWLVSM